MGYLRLSHIPVRKCSFLSSEVKGRTADILELSAMGLRQAGQQEDDDESKDMSVNQLMDEYKQQHGRSAVQIYSTDQQDIYIFGYVCCLSLWIMLISRVMSGCFRTRKIHLSVLNGQLMVRVGGGYVSIDEFVANNAPHEARKVS